MRDGRRMGEKARENLKERERTGEKERERTGEREGENWREREGENWKENDSDPVLFLGLGALFPPPSSLPFPHHSLTFPLPFPHHSLTFPSSFPYLSFFFSLAFDTCIFVSGLEHVSSLLLPSILPMPDSFSFTPSSNSLEQPQFLHPVLLTQFLPSLSALSLSVSLSFSSVSFQFRRFHPERVVDLTHSPK